MGKFTNVNYTSTIDNLVKATKDKLDNPWYIFSDQKPTKVNYYKQNAKQSTLDDGTKQYYDPIGYTSPIKYDFIKDFYLYGIDRINPSFELGEFGLEAGLIEGEAVVLPKTISPVEGDFFTIGYIKEKLLFRVNKVDVDTLENGNNVYKFQYSLFKDNAIEDIEKNINKRYTFIVNNIGTEFNTVLEDDTFNLVGELEDIATSLIKYYEELFFDNKVQAFVFRHSSGTLMYDPYLIEFLRRNNVLDSGDKYIYVAHQCAVDKTFGITYDKTFFTNFENQDKVNIEKRVNCIAKAIDDINSLFVTRMETFYQIDYTKNKFPYITRIQTINSDAIEMIVESKKVDKNDENSIYNLWVAYFDKEEEFISQDIVDSFKNFDFHNNMDCYYAIPLSIFIIEQYIKSIMS